MSDNQALITKKQFIQALREEVDRVINAGGKDTFIPLSIVRDKVDGGEKINDSYIRNILNRTKSVRLMGMVASVKNKTDVERGTGWHITLVASKTPDPKSKLGRTRDEQRLKVAITIVQVLAKLEEKGVTAASLLSGDVIENLTALMEGGDAER